MSYYADVTRSSSAEQYDKYQRIGVYVNTYIGGIDKIFNPHTTYFTKYHTIECISSAEDNVLNRHNTSQGEIRFENGCCLLQSHWPGSAVAYGTESNDVANGFR
jgi:hypothetical protein